MQHNFEYCYVEQAQDTLDVECIGNTCIKMFNDLGYYWYICIETNLGFTKVLQHGPYLDEHVDDSFQIIYNKMSYDEKKLCNLIDKDLSNRKRDITQAFIVDPSDSDDALKRTYQEYEQRNNSQL